MKTPASRTAAEVTAEPATGTASPGRAFEVDWLRIIALGVLIPYHVGMAYVSWPWHVKSTWSSTVAAAVEPWMRLAAPWRMSLVFVVSGLALGLMLERRRGAPGWLRGRAKRLLLPLATAVVLVVPAQSYFEVRQFHGYAGSYGQFLLLYFSAYGGFCQPDRGCLILPTWNHLWFVPYLFVYTALVAGIGRRWPAAFDHAAQALITPLAGVRLFVWPIAWFTLTRLALLPAFGQTHALVDDVFAHAQFAPTFALGLLLARPAVAAALLPRIDRARHLALALLLLSWAVLGATAPGAAWRAMPWSTMQWCGIVAALGYARAHLQRDSALRRYLSGAVFPVYLFHQTVTVAALVWLAPLGLSAAAEAAWLIVLTLAVSLAGYELVRHMGALAIAFGVAKGRTARRLAPAQAKHGPGRPTSQPGPDPNAGVTR